MSLLTELWRTLSNKIYLQINGGWSEWTFWSACSLTCVEENSIQESVRSRRRQCNSPLPDLGGKPCSGGDLQEEICSVPYCPIDGKWSDWSAWSGCSASCGSGTKIRYRKCNNPPAIHGGAYCSGENVESSSCYVTSCSGKNKGTTHCHLISSKSLSLSLCLFLAIQFMVVGQTGHRGRRAAKRVATAKNCENVSAPHRHP